MNIGVIGLGYVGFITAAGFAKTGFYVCAADIDKQKVDAVSRGTALYQEDGIEELLREVIDRGNFTVTTDCKLVVDRCEAIFICTATPPDNEGKCDISQVEAAVREIGEHMKSYKLIVIKSTVPPGTTATMERILKECTGCDFDMAFSPEFIREGSMVHDFFNPDRIVAGVTSDRARGIMDEIFRGFTCPILYTKRESAELIKYASNTFLALKLSYINEISDIAKSCGGDIKDIIKGMGYDRRIGFEYFNPGLGFGGPCLEKDTKALLKYAEECGCSINLLPDILKTNEGRLKRAVDILEGRINLKRSRICILGVSFKGGSGDIRNSQGIKLAQMMRERGAEISGYDPLVKSSGEFKMYDSPYEACTGADAIVVCNESREFRELDYERIKKLMRGNFILDTRYVLKDLKLDEPGLKYETL